MKKHKIYFSKVFLCILFLFSFLFAQQRKILARIRYDFGSSGEIEYLKVLKPDGNVHLEVNPLGCPSQVCGQDWENMTETEVYSTLSFMKEAYNNELEEQYGNIKGILRGIFALMSDQEKIKIDVVAKMPIASLPLGYFGMSSDSLEVVNDKQFIVNASKQNLMLMMFHQQIETIELYMEKVLLSGGDENRANCPPRKWDDPLHSDIIMRSWARVILNFPEGEQISFARDNVWDAMEQYSGTGLGVKYSTREGGSFYDPYVDDIMGYYLRANIVKQNLEIDPDPGNYLIDHWNGHKHMSFRCGLAVASESTPYYNKDLDDYGALGIQTWSRSTYSADGLEKWAYSPIVFACAPTGNDCNGAVVGLTSYNQLIVGGTEVTWNMYNDDDYHNKYFEIMEEKFNLPFVYGAESEQAMTQHGNNYTSSNRKYQSDREMPHVVACSRVNGTGAMEEYWQLYLQHQNKPAGIGGTSAGTPSVNGVGACVISAFGGRSNSLELIDPTVENIRVAIMVTAENIDDGHWDPLEDGRDGVGVVSGFNAVKFANTVPQFDQGDNAQENGLVYGQLRPGDPDPYVIKIKAPDDFTDGEHLNKHLRAVLTWSKSLGDSVDISDLDLELRNASTHEWIGGCYSFEDNHEVIDLEPRQLIPGQEYNLSILVKNLAIGTDPIADHIKYSVGWTWVKDYAGKIVDGNSVIGLNTDYGTIDDGAAQELVDKNLTLRNRNIRLSKNLTINRPNTTVPILASKTIQIKPNAWGDQISLKPGSNSTIRLHVCEMLHLYQFYDYGRHDHNDPTLLDGAGDMDGIRVVDGVKKHGTGAPPVRSFLETKDFSPFDGLTYYELNVNEVNGEKIVPDMKEHKSFSLGVWLRLEPDVKDGYIYSATDPSGEEGVYLKIKENDGYGIIEFYIGGNSSNRKSIFHTLQHDELYLKRANPNNPSIIYTGSPRSLHIAAVWKSRNFMKLYVNGEEVRSEKTGIPDNYSISGDTRYYIGKGASSHQGMFKGAMGYLRIYAGVLREKFIKSQFHEYDYPMYPNNGGKDWIDLELRISGSGSGFIEYGREYYSRLVFDPEQSGQNHMNYVIGNGAQEHGPYSNTFTFVPERGFRVYDVEVGGQIYTHNNGTVTIPIEYLYSIQGDKTVNGIIHEIPNYSSKFNYVAGDVVIKHIGAEPRIFECLAPNGPTAENGVQTPHNETTSIEEFSELFWIEHWRENGIPYNPGNLIKYTPLPNEPQSDSNCMFLCETGHNSSLTNSPGFYLDAENPWKISSFKSENSNYQTGDYVLLNPEWDDARLFLCLRDNPGTYPKNGEINFDVDDWLEHWIVNRPYNQRDYLVYKNSKYVCIQQHKSSLVNKPDGDNGSDFWSIFTDWNASTSYNVGDLVMYDNINNSYPCPKVLYRCKSANSGMDPDLNPSIWEPYLPIWEEGIQYSYRVDLVRYNNTNFVCTNDHVSDQSNKPDIGSAPWQSFTDWQNGTYYTSGDLVKFSHFEDELCETIIYLCLKGHTAVLGVNDPFMYEEETWDQFWP